MSVKFKSVLFASALTTLPQTLFSDLCKIRSCHKKYALP